MFASGMSGIRCVCVYAIPSAAEALFPFAAILQAQSLLYGSKQGHVYFNGWHQLFPVAAWWHYLMPVIKQGG
jgi:hypothetical protein